MFINIYSFNYRGYGNSTGNPSIENILKDSEQVIEKVYSIADKSIPTILMGYSLGCFTCLNSYKSSVINNWIKGYVCISAFSGIEDLTIVFGATSNDAVIDPKLKRLDNQKSVSRIDVPILFIHGAQDNFIPKFMSEKLYKICPSRNKKLLLIENAGHNDIFKDNNLDKIINEIKLMIKNIER
ncbi:alpha/beta hydrolase [Caloranaerobacter sp. DY30410]|uniref:alpha/beta hydrolase n=1 Tax=Caloranaerobacter sp. DY30410 TaxID=3238305 RepID=UPI003CFC2796